MNIKEALSIRQRYTISGFLDLSNMKISTLEGMEEIEQMKDIQVLNLGYNKLTSLKGFKKPANLKALILNGNLLKNLKEDIQLLKDINHIEMEDCELTSIEPFKLLTETYYLNLSYNQITDKGNILEILPELHLVLEHQFLN